MQAYLEFIQELLCTIGPVENARISVAEEILGQKFPGGDSSRIEQERFWCYYRATVRMMEAEALANLLLGRGYILNPIRDEDEPDVDQYAGG